GQWAEAEAVLRAAQATAAAQETSPLLWRIQASLAKLYHAQGRSREAEAAAASAHGTIAELAADLPDGTLRDQFVARATALLPLAHVATPRQAAKRSFGGLTEREREVAVLIA